MELFVRKNKDDKISKEFYYLGPMTASGKTKEFKMANTEKTAVEIEWILDVPVKRSMKKQENRYVREMMEKHANV